MKALATWLLVVAMIYAVVLVIGLVFIGVLTLFGADV